MPYDYCDYYDLDEPDYEIDPDSIEAYDFPLAADLNGDTIVSIEVLNPDGLTVDSSSFEDSSARVIVRGAQCARTYRLTVRYTTAAGLRRDKTIVLIGRSQ